MSMPILNKLLSKVIFSDATQLNVSASDLGEQMISVSIEDDVVSRLRAATGTVASASIYVQLNINIHVLKTSPVFESYAKAILGNAIVGGTVTVYDDRGVAYTGKDVSLNLKEIPNMNGTEPAVNFIVQCNLPVNTGLMVGVV